MFSIGNVLNIINVLTIYKLEKNSQSGSNLVEVTLETDVRAGLEVNMLKRKTLQLRPAKRGTLLTLPFH